jgi:acetoin utilization deacetylase AcuC-like enzyme
MKIIFHENFKLVYDYDPAAARGRMECIVEELQDAYEFIEPQPAKESDILLVHEAALLNWVQSKPMIYELALLSAGGAIKAAHLAAQGEPAFALIRPPGHHASSSNTWGFCWFNNVAVAVEKLRRQGLVNKVLIVDIDLHFGDGTSNIFEDVPEVFYYHLYGLQGLEECLKFYKECDLVAISAGFDMHKKDWGLLLSTEDYTTIGKMIAAYARRVCGGRVFAVLEGGYNHRVLGKNVKALLEGLD